MLTGGVSNLQGCLVGFDCAHAVGNVPMKLHDWNVDFAAWCSYKYLNAGPGGIAGLFVHDKWASTLGRLSGWWGHDSATRFDMPSRFSALPGARGWQLSNPSVLDVISLYSSLQIFEMAGQLTSRRTFQNQMEVTQPFLGALRDKSEDLTGYLEALLRGSRHYVDPTEVGEQDADDGRRVRFTVITPSDPRRRGAQLSLLFEPTEVMDEVFGALRKRGVLGDERRPGVIRFAPVPLYNSWSDVQMAASALDEIVDAL